MVTRTLPPLSADQLEQVKQKVVAACKEVGGMQWVRSHITADGKHSFCEFLAPNEDACRRHAQIAGLPVDDVYSVGDEIGPGARS
jgi:hypothetical protein